MSVRHSIAVDLSMCDEPDVPFVVQEALYRIAQEALHNALKHARPDRLAVCLAYNTEGLTLTVADNGRGFDPQAAYPGHLGLRSMRERAEKASMAFAIASAPGRGTRVQARVALS